MLTTWSANCLVRLLLLFSTLSFHLLCFHIRLLSRSASSAHSAPDFIPPRRAWFACLISAQPCLYTVTTACCYGRRRRVNCCSARCCLDWSVLGAATPHGPRVAASYSFLFVFVFVIVSFDIVAAVLHQFPVSPRVALNSSASATYSRLSCVERSSIYVRRIGLLPHPHPPSSSVTILAASRPLRPTIDSLYVTRKRLVAHHIQTLYWLCTKTPTSGYELGRSVSVPIVAKA